MNMTQICMMMMTWDSYCYHWRTQTGVLRSVTTASVFSWLIVPSCSVQCVAAAAAVSPLHATACCLLQSLPCLLQFPVQQLNTKYPLRQWFWSRQKIKIYKLCECTRVLNSVWKMWLRRHRIVSAAGRRGEKSMADIHIHKFVTWPCQGTGCLNWDMLTQTH